MRDVGYIPRNLLECLNGYVKEFKIGSGDEAEAIR